MICVGFLTPLCIHVYMDYKVCSIHKYCLSSFFLHLLFIIALLFFVFHFQIFEIIIMKFMMSLMDFLIMLYLVCYDEIEIDIIMPRLESLSPDNCHFLGIHIVAHGKQNTK